MITLIVIAVTIFNLATKVWEDLGNLETAKRDNMQWMLSQLEVDYLNIRVEQKSVTSVDVESLDDLRARFDVFYSRISILRQGEPFDVIRSDPDAAEAINLIWDYLQKYTPLIDGGDENLTAQISQFSDDTSKLAPYIRSLALGGIEIYAKQSGTERQDFSQTLIIIASLTLILLSALAILFWVFVRQYRHLKNHSNDTQIVSSRLNAVVTSALDGVIVINRDAKILEFNESAEKIFGYTKQEAIGGDLAEMIIPDHLRQAHRDGMQRYLDTREKRVVGKGRIKLEAKRKSNEVFPVELSISGAESDDGEVFVAYLRDISNRVREEEELKQARDDALAGEKAKAELLAVMSHEMRTPLNGMLGTLELLKETRLNGQQNQYLNIMNISGEMLLHHVNDVLDISRLDSGKFDADLKSFDIKQLIDEICESQGPNADINGNVIKAVFENFENYTVFGDEIGLRQILLNILGNANKFTRDGNITVTTNRRDNDFIEIGILDTGLGIQTSDLGRIFDDFVTLDSSYGRTEAGTGLGLGITKRMVHAMNGSIGVESEKDKGSLFWVYLPLPQHIEVKDQVNSVPEPQDLIIKPQNILVVEDNEINRFVVRQMLEKDGHNVTEANDGDEGVTICKNQAFDLILMDISMPLLDGVEATKLIRNSEGPCAKTPIIALTAHALPDEIIRFKEVGMNDTLIKPITVNSLRETMKIIPHPDKKQDARSTDVSVLDAVDHDILSELKQTLGQKKSDTLIQKFIDETGTELNWIKSNQKVSSKAEFVKRVHKLAGSASLFGAVQLHQQLAEIETTCKTNKSDDLSIYIKQLDAIWLSTHASLSRKTLKH